MPDDSIPARAAVDRAAMTAAYDGVLAAVLDPCVTNTGVPRSERYRDHLLIQQHDHVG